MLFEPVEPVDRRRSLAAASSSADDEPLAAAAQVEVDAQPGQALGEEQERAEPLAGAEVVLREDGPPDAAPALGEGLSLVAGDREDGEPGGAAGEAADRGVTEDVRRVERVVPGVDHAPDVVQERRGVQGEPLLLAPAEARP